MAYSVGCLLALAGSASAQGPAPARQFKDLPPIDVAPPSPPPLVTRQVPAAPKQVSSPQPASKTQMPLSGKPVSTQLPRPASPTTRTMHFPNPPQPSPVRQAQHLAQIDPKLPMPKEGAETRTTLDDLLRYQIRLDPPGPELVFRLESEAALEQRMRQEAKQQNLMESVVFPPLPILSKTEYQGRSFPQQVVFAEPHYVNYRRLLFEEKNAERYGWDFGIAQPMISSFYFVKDVLLLPNNLVSYPLRCYETSAGECLPGDPVPYILYPPEFTKEGILAELGVGTALFFIVP
jgi:hypothetical protein